MSHHHPMVLLFPRTASPSQRHLPADMGDETDEGAALLAAAVTDGWLAVQ